MTASLGDTAERMAMLPADVPRDAVIVTRNLQRDYDMGGEMVHAPPRRGSRSSGRTSSSPIMGPSGSGKSTLMNLIGCLDSPTDGEYWLNGHRVSELGDDELARIRNKEIGFVFQTFNLLPRATALHNVELPLVYAGRRRAASGATRPREALSARRPRRPDGAPARTSCRAASGSGWRSPARWSTSPSILLADEPTGNLDSADQRGDHGPVRGPAPRRARRSSW